MSTSTTLRVRGRAGSTLAAVRGVVTRRDTAAVFAVVTGLYTLVYLWAIGDLAVQSTSGVGIDVVAPVSRSLETGLGRFSFEGIAVVDLGVARYLLSPLNVIIAGGIGALVGLNMALSYLASVRPSSCGIGASSGLLASIPALLSGSACCAPVLLIVLGVTASGALVTAITWLLPVSVILLVVTLVYMSGRIDATALRA